jgi:acetyl-CoA C-acetyltransferase
MTTEPVYILSAVRTAIGDFGGGLMNFAPSTLGKLVIEEAVKRAGIAANDVGHVVMGQVIQSEPRDAYLSRVSAIEAGIPIEAPALTLNRLCGSHAGDHFFGADDRAGGMRYRGRRWC